MSRVKYLVPNFFTGLSLLSALIAIHYISINELILAPWLIMFSMICDFLDGKLARLLDAASPFGAQFDTLSDFVAFGIAPAFLIYRVSLQYITILGAAVAIFYAFCGCYRLVRFSLRNTDLKSKGSFVGLPIPVAAGFLSSLVLLNLQTWNRPPNHIYLLIAVFLISLLMISRVEYLTIEQDTLFRKDFRLLFLIFLVSLIFSFHFFHIAILFWIAVYILFCLIRQILLLLLSRNRLANKKRG